MAKIKGVKGIRLRIRELPSGHKRQYLDIHRNGTRSTEAVPFGTLTGNPLADKEAKIRADEYLKKRISDFESGFGTNRAKEAKKSFLEYCEKLGEQRTAKNTRTTWRNAVKHLRDYAGEGCSFANLDRKFFEGFKHYLTATAKLSPGAAWLYLAAIKTAVHRSVEEGIIERDPSKKITIKKRSSLPVHLEISEIRRLSKTPCPNEQVKSAFLFSCFSGLRYSDTDGLTWDALKDGYLEFRQRKTGEAERLPLSEEAQKILRKQKHARPSAHFRRTFPKGQVFFMPRQNVVNRQLKAWAKAAKIDKPISFHKSRHTFATLSLSSGVDLYTTSKLLGHKSLQMTAIYAKVIDQKKREAVALLPTLRQRGDRAS
jgi:integrase